MDFNLSEEQELFKEMMRKFVDKEIKPKAAEIDEAGEVSSDRVREGSASSTCSDARSF